MSKHDALRAEWEKQGKPAMDYRRADLGDLSAWMPLHKYPSWHDEYDYRFAGDPHHQLRLEWLQSGKTLVIEVHTHVGWMVCDPLWVSSDKYRKSAIAPGPGEISAADWTFVAATGRGDFFIMLGQALNNPHATIQELENAARMCGLEFKFNLVKADIF
jgi:hypothetical protein